MGMTARLGRNAFAIAISAIALTGPAAARTDAASAFQPSRCDMPDVTDTLRARLVCGTVAVPRNHGATGAAGFRLAVVIIKPETGSPSPDPVVYIAGGPGSPLTARAAFIATYEASILAPGRDLILVDQRGAGRSEPELCPGLARRQLEIFASGMAQAALIPAWRDTYAACRREMDGEDIKPEWFGTQVNAADFETVRQALGIARWNVYSLSYGTSVAMTMMAQHPAGLRSVVLDSVLPPDPLPMTLSQSFGHALTLLFAACHADAACDTGYPGLGATFEETSLALERDPLAIAMPAAGPGPKIFHLGGVAFRLIVNRALYSRATLAELPAFIAAAHDRRPQAMQGLVGRITHDYLAMSVADIAAVGCRDRPGWREPAPADRTGEPPASAFVPGMCADWLAPGPPPLIAAGSAVPSLVLSGAIDPITPPEFARIAVTALGARSTMVEFAHVGHGAAEASPCGIRLVGAFIQEPSQSIDQACGAAVPPIRFAGLPPVGPDRKPATGPGGAD